MLENLFWITTGLIIGWNVIPQPQWVQNLYEAARKKLREIFNND